MTNTEPHREQPDGVAAALNEAFAEEERAGMWIATVGRTVSVIIIAVLVSLFQQGAAEMLYVQGLLLIIILSGFAHYYVVRRRKPVIYRYLMVLLDFLLLAVSIFVPNPFETDIEPLQMMQRNGTFLYFIFVIVAYSFSYLPGLLRFAGIVSAAVWCTGVGLLLARPETLTLEVDELSPYYIDTELLSQTLVMMLLIAATLSAVVWRSRRLVARQATASRQRANLARHFSPRMVERLANREDVLGANRVQPVAVMFADIVGFTALADRLTPDGVVSLVRQFDALMEATVFEHDGTLDKFLGDGVMATFGTPEPGPRDATNALACGLAMQRAMTEFNKARTEAGEPAIRLAIGIHYGDVVIGDVGSERRLELAVLGDVVNVASRLEAANRPENAAIIVSRQLAARCETEGAGNLLADFSPEKTLSLHGKPEPFAARILGL